MRHGPDFPFPALLRVCAWGNAEKERKGSLSLVPAQHQFEKPREKGNFKFSINSHGIANFPGSWKKLAFATQAYEVNRRIDFSINLSNYKVLEGSLFFTMVFVWYTMHLIERISISVPLLLFGDPKSLLITARGLRRWEFSSKLVVGWLAFYSSSHDVDRLLLTRFEHHAPRKEKTRGHTTDSSLSPYLHSGVSCFGSVTVVGRFSFGSLSSSVSSLSAAALAIV